MRVFTLWILNQVQDDSDRPPELLEEGVLFHNIIEKYKDKPLSHTPELRMNWFKIVCAMQKRRPK